MKKNTTLILSTVLIGAGAYIIYSRNRKKANSGTTEDAIRDKQKEEADKAAKDAARDTAREQYNSLQNPNSYKSKVARVQGFLGVAIDGIVGPQTLGALKRKFPQFQFMNSTNIDAIIAAIFGAQNLQYFN
jgi:peptidoglycan hydrolase-like protein with peptidoglycan-binding domain